MFQIRKLGCNPIIQGLLIIITMTICVTIYVYDGKLAELKPTITDQIQKHLIRNKVANPEICETPAGRPYLIPSDEILSKLNETELLKIYWRYVHTLQILCRNQSRFGSLYDGGKEVCLDETYKPKKPCIVYSFGSKFQFDFELDAIHFLGCDVHTFDPSMDIRGKGKNRRIPKGITFREIGISDKDYVASNSWQLKTLKTIITENGHQEKILDILKIDVDGPEWATIPNILESGAYRQVKQLLVEFHFGHFMSKPGKRFWGNMDMAKQLRALRMLYDYGFRMFMKERVLANLWKMQESPRRKRKITTQNEFCFINIAFLHQ